MKKKSKEQIANEIREEAIKKNFKLSVQVTNKILRDMKMSIIFFLKFEQLKETYKKETPTVDIKSINSNLDIMEFEAVKAMLTYLITKYQIKIESKGEDK